MLPSKPQRCYAIARMILITSVSVSKIINALLKSKLGINNNKIFDILWRILEFTKLKFTNLLISIVNTSIIRLFWIRSQDI